jgi:NADPH:quinone reductase-like Zn-dependent oxidoreductase
VYACAFSEYGDAGVLRLRELPDPEPGPGEVTIAVDACGLNHLDLDSREGISQQLGVLTGPGSSPSPMSSAASSRGRSRRSDRAWRTGRWATR